MMVQNKYFFIFDLHFDLHLKKWLKNNESKIKKRIIKAWILVIKKSANLYLRQFADLEETDGIEGASPSHLLRKSPIVCPSRSAEANRARWTVGSIPFEKET